MRAKIDSKIVDQGLPWSAARPWAKIAVLALLYGSATGTALAPSDAAAYIVQDLVSNAGLAPTTDPNLLDPWGLTSSPTSPIWVADNGSGVATLYNGTGTPVPLVVSIPPSLTSLPGSAGTPTGIAFNGTSSFGGALFMMATSDGAITAWKGGTAASLVVDSGGAGAVYDGLAIANNGSQDLLYAANFNSGKIDVFNSSFNPVTTAGGFVDPNLPAGYAPFNIQTINGNLFVTYAQQDLSKKSDVAGSGHGFIDVYDANGNLLRRLVSGGTLDSPWGLALAPAGFGKFSGALLVGNSGNGTIDAFDPITGAFLGELDDSQGNPIVVPDVLGLLFGNSGAGGATDELFFAATTDPISGNGLFGDITPGAVTAVPEPTTLVLFLSGFVLFQARRARLAKVFS